MNWDFGNRVVVVVGGTSGIGLEIVRQFVDHGCRSVIPTSENPDAVEDAHSYLLNRGLDAPAIACDATRLESVQSFLSTVRDRYGRLDVLVNCQGIHHKQASRDVSDELFSRTIDVNLNSVFRFTREAYDLLKKTGGAVVNVGSMGSFVGLRDAAAYTASKGGVAQLTKALAVDWAEDGIRCNAVAPGWIITALSKAVLEKPEYREPIERRIPMGRIGDPIDVARVVLFLSSHYAGYITGAVIPVDGGALASV